jgi:hypothetical protein
MPSELRGCHFSSSSNNPASDLNSIETFDLLRFIFAKGYKRRRGGRNGNLRQGKEI